MYKIWLCIHFLSKTYFKKFWYVKDDREYYDDGKVSVEFGSAEVSSAHVGYETYSDISFPAHNHSAIH